MKYVLLPVMLVLLVFAAFAQSGKSIFLIAHRGGVVDSTNVENSLPALQAAIKKGYSMVEMDMRLTKDSVLIIQHDRNFKRYYGVDSAVSDMTWKQISQLVSNRGSKVLTLEEAFRHCQGKIQVMLDNKIEGNDTLLFAKVVALLKKYGLQEQALMIGTEESTPYFTGKVRLSCTRQQLEENSHKAGYSPAHYYLFSDLKNMSEADVKWAGQQGVMVVGVVNLFRYRQGGNAAKDIATLRSWGVTRFQIDSEFYPAFNF
ncbi:glycerophosphodiester phosphodiesterase family protein [Chitinophaga sp. MM2321]|uniref:glycerophosphodiester phosphodiesterase family protein n=1 Tax=Chitinophaga sp. MM2321 TaxID=3137178 RepID=UPI0032D5688C